MCRSLRYAIKTIGVVWGYVRSTLKTLSKSRQGRLSLALASSGGVLGVQSRRLATSASGLGDVFSKADSWLRQTSRVDLRLPRETTSIRYDNHLIDGDDVNTFSFLS